MDDNRECIPEEPKFVLYEDYKLLKRRIAELEARIANIERTIRNLGEQAFDLSYME